MKTQELTYFQLRELAQEFNIPGWSRMRKSDLKQRIAERLSMNAPAIAQPVRAA
ncbi:MAG: Rho termination factor N-terminal domain-containing protein [Synechococcus sp.]